MENTCEMLQMGNSFIDEEGCEMRIYLRPVTLDDGAIIVKWRNSPKVSDVCFDKTPLTIEMNKNFYNTFIETGKYKQYIVERVDEDFGVSSYAIATVYLKDMDLINKRCQLCIFTSDDQEWNTESQSIAIKMLLDKAFTEFGMHKVYTYVFADNKDEVALMKRAGLSEEAVLEKEAVNLAGEYVNVLRMTILVENYKKAEKHE